MKKWIQTNALIIFIIAIFTISAIMIFYVICCNNNDMAQIITAIDKEYGSYITKERHKPSRADFTIKIKSDHLVEGINGNINIFYFKQRYCTRHSFETRLFKENIPISEGSYKNVIIGDGAYHGTQHIKMVFFRKNYLVTVHLDANTNQIDEVAFCEKIAYYIDNTIYQSTKQNRLGFKNGQYYGLIGFFLMLTCTDCN